MFERERRGIEDKEFRTPESFAVLKSREMWSGGGGGSGAFCLFCFWTEEIRKKPSVLMRQ